MRAGPDSDTPRMLPALKTNAQPLRFLDFLIRDPAPAVVLHGSGIYVHVPAPERYAVHKLILSLYRYISWPVEEPEYVLVKTMEVERLSKPSR
jgi:hypothetical protein